MRGVGGADIEMAIALFKAGNPAGAAQSCRNVLRHDRRNVTALFLLALTQMQERNFEEAEHQFAKATKLDPKAAEIWANRGNNQIALGRPERALEFLARALALEPNFPEALYNQAKLLADAGRLDAALAAYDKCIALVPQFADALNNRGAVLAMLGRKEEALASYEKCLAIMPNAADTLNSRGSLLAALGRRGEALASYDASLAIAPDIVDTLVNRANLLASLRRTEEALAGYDRAMLVAPHRPELLDRRGNFLAALGRDDEAFASFDRCVSIAPNFAAAWLSAVKLLLARKRFEEARNVIGRLLAVAPDADFAQGCLAFAKLSLCDWDGLREVVSALRDQVRQAKAVTLPFHAMLTLDSPQEQLLCAKARAALEFPRGAVANIAPGRYDHDRIRLAYLSADFRDHPVSRSLAGLIERHDRSRFETIAISFGPDDDSEMRARIKGAFERFIDVDALGDFEAAKLLRTLEVDIAVDLMGFTEGCRPGILAPHPAPLQVAFLGYAGTTGTDFIDYIIADRVAVPEQQRAFYSEHVVHVPDCCQPGEPAPGRGADARAQRSGIAGTWFRVLLLQPGRQDDARRLRRLDAPAFADRRQRVVASGRQCDGIRQSAQRSRAARRRSRTAGVRAASPRERRPSRAPTPGRPVSGHHPLQCPHLGERRPMGGIAGRHLPRPGLRRDAWRRACCMRSACANS